MRLPAMNWSCLALVGALLCSAGATPGLRAQLPPGPPIAETLPDPTQATPETVPAPRAQARSREALPEPVANLMPEAVQPIVVDVRVEGNETTPLERVRPMVRTRKGRPLDPRVVEEDVRRLHASKMFLDVQPVYTQVNGGVVLTFQVIERATLKYVKYEGNEKVADRKLAKQAGIKRGDAADPYAVEDARGKMEQWLHEKGHTKATVTIAEGNKPGDQGAVFIVHEGPQQRVGKIVFEGNSIAPDGRMTQLIQTKKPFLRIPKIFAGFKGYAEKEKIDADIDALTAYYRGLGFFQAKVGREVIFDDKQEWATLRFVINEGVRYKVRGISFAGNKIRTPEQLSKKFKLAGGDFYNQSDLNSDVTTVEEQYGVRGHLFVKVEPETRFLEQPGEVDLVYKVTEGPKCRIGQINVHISGEDPHTRRMTVLNRLSIRPGDIADIRQIRDSERRLKASGLFMSDPTQGEPPKIVFREPNNETEDVEAIAEKPKDGERFRGQSPDIRALPGEALVELQIRPDGTFRVAPLQSQPLGTPPGAPRPGRTPAKVRFQSPDNRQTTRRPVAQPRPNYQVRFQDMGGAEMPSFDLRQNPPTYGAPSGQAYPSQPYAQSQQPAYGAPQTQVYGQPPAQSYAAPQAQGFTQQPSYSLPPQSPPVYQGAPRNTMPPTAAGAMPYQAAPQVAPSYQGNAVPNPRYLPSSPSAASPYVGAQSGAAPQLGAPQPQYGVAQPQAMAGAPPIAPPGGFNPFNPTVPNTAVGPQGAGQLPPPQGYDNPEQLLGGATDPNQWLNQPPTVEVPLDVYVQEAQTGRLMLGVGVNSNAGLIGNIVLDEQNFDWRRWPRNWADIRNATAFRGGGQRFRLEAMPGSQLQRYMFNFTEPYFLDTGVSLGLSAYYYNRLFTNWFEQRVGGRPTLGYQFAPDLSAAVSLRAENVRITNPTVPTPWELQRVLGSNALYSARFMLTHDTRDSPFLPTQGHRLMFAYEQGFGDFTFPRGEVEGSQYFLLRQRADGSGRHTLSLISMVGFTGADTPIFENFFAGGFGTIRGFRFRGASPTDMGVIIGGRFQWLNTAEYMFPITASDAVRGVAFVDFGTVETNINLDNFRVAPGLGLRITLPALGPAPIALDFAVPVVKAATDQTQVFSFNVGIAR